MDNEQSPIEQLSKAVDELKAAIAEGLESLANRIPQRFRPAAYVACVLIVGAYITLATVKTVEGGAALAGVIGLGVLLIFWRWVR